LNIQTLPSIEELNDAILVSSSGGKNSVLMEQLSKLFLEIQKKN
jgi:predicted phosphoadenosine phosphosulfate sulfurtransferase